VPWSPKTIKRFIRGFPTSCHTALVETDVGPGYLKAMGGPEGPHTLASELVATHLARWLGFPALDFAIIRVDEVDEIPFVNDEGKTIGHAQVGPAFITRAEAGDSWSGQERQLAQLVNPDAISRLVVLDTWLLNCDRYSWPKQAALAKAGIRRRNRPRIKRDNVFLSEEAPDGQFLLKAIDHTHCFTCGHEWSRQLKRIDTIRDPRLFGLFPEFKRFLDRKEVELVVRDMSRISETIVTDFMNQVPPEWEVTKEASEALVELVVARAAYVAETVVRRIWPQRELGFTGSVEIEPTS